MAVPSAEDFKKALQEEFEYATREGDDQVVVLAADLHRKVAGYTGMIHLMPTCCVIMRQAMGEGDVIIRDPMHMGSGELKIAYRLPRRRSSTLRYNYAGIKTRPGYDLQRKVTHTKEMFVLADDPYAGMKAPNEVQMMEPDVKDVLAPPVPIDGKVAFVCCSEEKTDNTSRAKDMYISPFFKQARRYVERNYKQWYILSPKYYMLDPNRVIDPYSKSLTYQTAFERSVWAEVVHEDIMERFPKPEAQKLFFYTKRIYSENLVNRLRKEGYFVEEPIGNLSVGDQIAWFIKHSR